MRFINSRGLLRIFCAAMLASGLSACSLLLDFFEQTEPTVLEITGEEICPALTADVTYNVNCDVIWTASMADQEWVHIEMQTAVSKTEGIVVLRFEPNRGTDRYCTLIITAGSQSISKTITQAGIGKFFQPSEINLTGVEQTTLSFEAPYNWLVTIEQGEEWIKLNNGRGEPGHAEVLVSPVDANENVGSRSGSLKVSIGNEYFSIPVYQGQKNVVLADDSTVPFDYKGGEFTVNTRSNIAYRIEVSDRWIQHLSTKALNEAQEQFTVSRNSSTEARTATISFIGTDDPSVVLTVTVNQEGIDPMLLNTTPGVYGLDGQTYTFGKNGWNLSSRVEKNNGDFEYRMLNRANLQVVSLSGIDPAAAEGKSLKLHLEFVQKDQTLYSQSYTARVIGNEGELMWLLVNESVLIVIQK